MHNKRNSAFIVFLIVTVLKSVSAGKEGRSGGTSAKSSFLASLNPSRWGRSSNAAPDRPPPPKDPISLHKPNPSLPNHKEKVRTWIKQQGILHISLHKPNPSLPNHKEKVRTWIKQQGILHISLHKPNPSLPNHKEKVRNWIKQQGILHISLHKPNPSLPNHKEKVRTWIKQQGILHISTQTQP